MIRDFSELIENMLKCEDIFLLMYVLSILYLLC